MITATRLPEPSTTERHGRFGRTGRPLAPRTDAAPDYAAEQPDAAPYANYVVDPEAVAAAIVERLMAGRGFDLDERQ